MEIREDGANGSSNERLSVKVHEFTNSPGTQNILDEHVYYAKCKANPDLRQTQYQRGTWRTHSRTAYTETRDHRLCDQEIYTVCISALVPANGSVLTDRPCTRDPYQVAQTRALVLHPRAVPMIPGLFPQRLRDPRQHDGRARFPHQERYGQAEHPRDARICRPA